VVAALTIPTLINNHKKTQTITQLKEIYAILTQTVKFAEVDYGSTDSWDWGPTSNLALTTLFADTYFYPYIKTVTRCDSNSTVCWNSQKSISNVSSTNFNSATSLSAILPSGASVYFWTGGSALPHVQIWVDVNGPNKGGNKIGNDIFHFLLFLKADATYKQGLFPTGLEYQVPYTRAQLKSMASVGCSTSISATMAGRECSGLIVLDGWKIADDYPWD